MAGLVAPYINVYDGFTPRENLAFLARVRRLDRAPDRIAQTLDFVGLSPRADDPVATFSSGLKQRVRLAVALVAEPPLLLLDEPTTNLDDAGRDLVRRLIERRRAAVQLLVLATNDASEAGLGDRCLQIEDYR
jgi:heme exporter protein A